MPTEQLPLAVYGTLRRGFWNHDLLAGRIRQLTPGYVAGYELVVIQIPYARPNPDARLVVEIAWPFPALYDQVLADIDRLEGYNPYNHPQHNFYTRVKVIATTNQQDEVEAWLYEVGPHTLDSLADLPAVPGNDYAT